ncbi:LOG family protein YvdD [Corynebacterium ciconiae DSM 44920]|uniref:TIGR00730 family Rossman fold protein n=1 Tax=Corynebacterium ciconiae TaxID=227319 RepID=UPI00037ADC91|nr:TIGR00730 family Rossman fold protein [Corynebacterium ciconiae]WKD60421.1 LOG family protein YvdD [Corynebacterium ciconiae DSM 44920]
MSVDSSAISAVIIRDPRRRVLTLAPSDSGDYTLPLQPQHSGESAEQAALRALSEQLGISLEAEQLTRCGVFTAEPEHSTDPTAPQQVSTTLFLCTEPVEAAAEQADRERDVAVRWVDPYAPGEHVAPLLKQTVLPYLSEQPVHSVAVFTGASTGKDGRHLLAARELGAALAATGTRLVYGGGAVGLMGAVASAALDAGGAVTGVMPKKLVDGEIAHPGLSQLDVVDSMHARKQRMSELADAFICLPGGTGTLDEFYDVWTGQQLGYHAKPIAFLGSDYWAPTMQALKIMVDEGFVRAEDYEALIVTDSPDDLLHQLRTWRAPTPKWA